MDARELIRRRKEETKAASELERLDQQDDNELRTNTGRNFRFVGRDPATGEMVARSGDGTLHRGRGVSNTELTSGSPMQVLDSGGKLQTFNFNPTKPDPLRDRTQSSTETMVGHVAVLFDCVINDGGEETAPKSSCKTVDDIWALYAIVRYVKIARSMVLFSFPKQNNTPSQYACPRYEFGQAEGGVWSCIQTNDPSAPYATATECQQKNKVTCGDDDIAAGIPLQLNTTPPSNRYISVCYPTQEFVSVQAITADLPPNVSRNFIVYNGEYPTGDRDFYVWDTSLAIDSISPKNRELMTYGNRIYTYSGRSPYYDNGTDLRAQIFNFKNGRMPRCGDSYVFQDLLLYYIIEGYCMIYDTLTGGHVSTVPNTWKRYVSRLVPRAQRYTYVVTKYPETSVSGWVEASNVRGCNDFDSSDYDHALFSKETSIPMSEAVKECTPPVVINPSKISREFWVGGHIETPIKLFEINEEDEYIWYGTLTSDGYIVTIKYGRELKNGVEVWCKVKQFKTSNFTDWRTVEYTGSHDLNPPLPSGIAGTLINTKNDRSNLTEEGIHEISLTQTLIGAGGLERTLKDELFVRPEPPLNDTTIMAEMTYTPHNGNPQTIPTEIFRIVDVIPTNLDIVTGACFSVKDVDIQLSPLYLNV